MTLFQRSAVRRALIPAALVTLVCWGTAAASAQTTYYVDGFCGDDAWTGLSATCGAPDGPKRTIQAGIDAAEPGDLVLVFGGRCQSNGGCNGAGATYSGVGNKNLDFAGKAITLRAWALNCCWGATIDCEGDGRAFWFHSQETPDATVESFYIVNGSMPDGAGILCEDGSNPTIVGCAFEQNTATGVNTCAVYPYGGGAVRCNGSSPTLIGCAFDGNRAFDGAAVYMEASSPTLIDCTFSANRAEGYDCSGGGALGIYHGSSPAVIGCAFIGNSASGCGGATQTWFDGGHPTFLSCAFSESSATVGGVTCDGGSTSATFIDCTFSGNSATGSTGSGGAVYAQDPGALTCINCAFVGNSAAGTGAGGGLIAGDRDLTLRNCLFSGNRAYRGGGARITSSSVATLTGCTFSGNLAARSGGAISNDRNSPTTVNSSLLWANTAPNGRQIGLGDGGWTEFTISNSDVQGGQGGVYIANGSMLNWGPGNIDADPLFVRNPSPGPDGQWGTPDDDYGDLRVTAGSPCIDTGDPAFVPQPGETDIDSFKRVWDSDANGSAIVDMGAYEFGSHRYGDLNCDGVINFDDIDPFVLALSDPAGYAGQYPNCDINLADISGDSLVDFADIDPFVALLSG